jgi:hypothetical protein
MWEAWLRRANAAVAARVSVLVVQKIIYFDF